MNSKKQLTLGSLFDGSGGFPLGGLFAGIMPVWASEIEPFPIRVTTKRMPFVKHHGDISRMNGRDIEPVDIVTFGSPCQDMSVAGCRDGLGGSRSSLFYEAIRVVKEMRSATNGEYPKYIVWENVPGAFSSNRGQDFKSVLEEVCKIKDPGVSVPFPGKWETAGRIMGDGYSVAWRQLDAQFWGVPQRRKRIYLVADFTGGCAGKILFESEGLSRYSAEGFRAWQGTPGAVEERIGETGDINAIPVESNPQDSRAKLSTDGVVQTLTGRMGTGGNQVPLLLKIRSGCEGGGKGALIQRDKSATISCYNDQTLFQPTAYGVCSKASHSMMSDNPHSGFYKADTSRCLDANGGNPSCNQGGVAVVSVQGSMIGRSVKNGPQGSGVGEDISFTLNTADRHAVAFSEKSATLSACDYIKGPFGQQQNVPHSNFVCDTTTESFTPDYVVRRLTPTECARLQGFPDWWCDDIGTEDPTQDDIEFWSNVFEVHRKVIGKPTKPKTENQIRKWLADPHSDLAEYKMWGNGVALPNVAFVLSGIAYYAEL